MRAASKFGLFPVSDLLSCDRSRNGGVDLGATP